MISSYFLLLLVLLVSYTCAFVPIPGVHHVPNGGYHPHAHGGSSQSNVYPTLGPLPDWWQCLNYTGDCLTYSPPCPSKNTVHKHHMRDMMEATYYGNALWMFLLLDGIEDLLVMPANFTITGRDNITAYFTAFNADGTKTGRYTLPQNYTIAEQIQTGLQVVTFANATAPSLFFQGQTEFTPQMWYAEYDQHYRIKHLRISVDSIWYPELQQPPSTQNLIYTNISLPPFRLYDRCVGRRDDCFGYEEPCPMDTNNLIYKETLFLVFNITMEPLYDQVLEFYSDNSYIVTPFLSFYELGNVYIATYYQLLNPHFGDPWYLYEDLTGYTVLFEGNQSFVMADYLTNWIITQVVRDMNVWWMLEFDETHRLAFSIIEPDTAQVIADVNHPVVADPVAFCQQEMAVCIGNATQYPVPSGPYKGLTCSEMVSQNVTGMALYSNPEHLATTIGFSLSCRQFHLHVSASAPIGSFVWWFHCQHTGGTYENPDGPNPCWNN